MNHVIVTKLDQIITVSDARKEGWTSDFHLRHFASKEQWEQAAKAEAQIMAKRLGCQWFANDFAPKQ